MELADKFILLIKYLFLGVFQGFTEPIPISSSGHLVMAQYFLGLEIEGMSFEVLVNFASLLAVLIIYRFDLLRLMENGFRFVTTRKPEAKSDFMFIIYLLIATIPAAVIGLLFEDFISEKLKSINVLGYTLVITGIALFLIRNLRGKKNDAELTLKDSVIIGIAQAIALIPGISRSGATIVAAMGLGMRQETALRFSFLLFIPVSAGTMLLSASDIINDPQISTLWMPYLLAFSGSLIASYFSLKWFMGIMARGNLLYFAIYCFIVGGAVILFA
ncbi:undecaprenyl-diphosphate phosphatase [Bacillus salitolerans]|uniref:Undecaprenyl-diphosphatase n=1 Tax=Bacillus salitolerans TaxID=1437434 RepID=A0ABW4LJS7_9BACI